MGTRKRKPQIGDHVVIHAWYCEMDGMEGDIIGINPEETMPYMVNLTNFRQWPFSLRELELCAIDADVYEGGWIDPIFAGSH